MADGDSKGVKGGRSGKSGCRSGRDVVGGLEDGVTPPHILGQTEATRSFKYSSHVFRALVAV